jgi:amino acid transporter
VLFLDYLLQYLNNDGEEVNKVLRFCLLAVTSIFLGYINWLGLPLVGKMSVTICLVAMSPFIILVLVGAWKVEPSRWLELPERDSTGITALENIGDDDVTGGFFPTAVLGGVLWRPFLNNLFWNLNSFDAAGSFAADIEDPARVLPKAMCWSVVMVASGYIFPLLVAIGASDAEQHEWVDGYLARVIGEVVGPWLGAWTVFAAAISNIALFQAELSADSFQLLGMADRGHIPKLFSQRSRHGTPTNGIILGTAVIVVLGASHLDQLIEMLNFNYSVSLLMEYCAFIKLRISRPDLHRPYRIPLNTFGCIIALLPTFFVTFIILGLATYTTLLFSLCVNIVGMSLFHCKQRSALVREDYDKVDMEGTTVPDSDSGNSSMD